MEVSKAKHTKCLSTKVGSIGQGLILSIVVARQDQVEIVGEWFLLGTSLQLSSPQKQNFHIQSSVFSVFNFQSSHALHNDHSEWGWVHIQHHPGSWWNADCVPFNWHCQAQLSPCTGIGPLVEIQRSSSRDGWWWWWQTTLIEASVHSELDRSCCVP